VAAYLKMLSVALNVERWEFCARKQLWPDLRYCTDIFMERLRRNTKYISRR